MVIEEGPRRAIFVAGMHRSGTSATAHAIAALGLKLPESPMGSALGNERGHWGESALIYELQRELLAEAGSSWDDVLPFPPSWLSSPAGAEWVPRMADAVRSEFTGDEPFVFKDPRICRQVPFWLAVCEELGVQPAFVVPLRNPLEVASSLARRDGFELAKGLLLWLRHNLDVERDTRGIPRAFITYEGLLRDPSGVMQAVWERIGLPWPGQDQDADLGGLVTADERHHEFGAAELEARAEVVGWVKRAQACLADACEAAAEPDPAVLDELAKSLADADLAYGPVLAATQLQRERAERKLSDADRAMAKLAALHSESHSLADRVAALETDAARDAKAIEAMQAERKALVARAHERELELLKEVERARYEATLSYRLKTAGRMLRRRLAQAQKTSSQLASWVLKPAKTRGVRSVYEFFVLRHSPLFDRAYYLHRNHDVANAEMNPVLHYIEYGARAGLDPSAQFSTSRYLAARPDVAESGINPLYHFVRFGRKEGMSGADVAPARGQGLRAMDARTGEPASLVRAPRRGSTSVSVVIPTYNRSEGVRSAVSSALGQSEPPLEVIVSDDGSTDGTEAALRAEFATEFATGKLVFVRSEERRGTSGARNGGLAAARGDLIAYLDSDNTWDPDYLLHMTSALAENEGAATAYAGIDFDDGSGRAPRLRFEEYDRELLLTRNFIDLNAFVHERRLHAQLGGFDEGLRRLVDWDLILRYTRQYPPVAVPMGLVNYDGRAEGSRVTTLEDFETNAAAVRRKLAYERVYSGKTPLRIGYVVWDYPSLSQTFVLDEIRQLRADGFDVNVYFHIAPDRAAEVDFDVPTYEVTGPEDLAAKVAEHDRTMLHSHFAYPATTRLAWPAANAARHPVHLHGSRRRRLSREERRAQPDRRGRGRSAVRSGLCDRPVPSGFLDRARRARREDLDRSTGGKPRFCARCRPRAPARARATGGRLRRVASCRRRAFPT